VGDSRIKGKSETMAERAGSAEVNLRNNILRSWGGVSGGIYAM